MEQLFQKSEVLTRIASSSLKRGIYEKIHWDSKLIGIKGARGTGKTTLLLQRLLSLKLPPQEALFLSLDDWYFTQHQLIDVAEEFIKKGGKYLFLDEVHKYPNWSIQIKNLYDYYDVKIVFTGSSILDIAKLEGDLSRRAVMYTMQGLSFREYLNLEYQFSFEKINLEQLLANGSESFRPLFPADFKPYKYFSDYLKTGYFPLFREGKEVYFTKLQQVVRQIVEYDMAELKGFDVRNAKKMLQLLGLIAQQVPFKPNVQKLAEKMDMNRLTLQNYLVFLGEAKLIHLLYMEGNSTSTLQKPEKIFFENTNLAYALSGNSAPEIGSLRETFVLNQLLFENEVMLSKHADFLLNQKWTLEIGGKNKKTKQIESIPDSLRILDDYDFTSNKSIIPIWLLGFLY